MAKRRKKTWLKNIERTYIKNSMIYSNEPFEVYYLISKFAKWSPRKTFYDSDEILIRLNDLYGTLPVEKKAFLIWFDQIEFHNTSLYKINELKTVSGLKLLDSTNIGLLYSLETKNSIK